MIHKHLFMFLKLNSAYIVVVWLQLSGEIKSSLVKLVFVKLTSCSELP